MATVKSHPLTYLSTVLSISSGLSGSTNFSFDVFQNWIQLKPVLGGVGSVASFITVYEQSESYPDYSFHSSIVLDSFGRWYHLNLLRQNINMCSIKILTNQMTCLCFAFPTCIRITLKSFWFWCYMKWRQNIKMWFFCLDFNTEEGHGPETLIKVWHFYEYCFFYSLWRSRYWGMANLQEFLLNRNCPVSTWLISHLYQPT